MEGCASQPGTAWGINGGSKLASGVSKICTNIFSGSPRSQQALGHHQAGLEADLDTADTGVVTVLDILELCNTVESDKDKESLDINNCRLEGVVAHFLAHTKAIVALQWDQS